MQYVWYIDIYFFVNFGMDFLLLKLLGKLLKVPVSFRRLAAGAGMGAAGSCLSVLLWRLPAAVSGGMIGLVTAAVMIGISFRPRTLRSFVKTLLLFFMEAFCIGGMMEAMYQHTSAGYYLAWILQGGILEGLPFLTAVFCALGAWFGFRFLWLNMTELRKERRHLYQIRLTAGDNSVRTVGYLDTGNCLQEPEQGLPVHIVSETLWNSLKMPESGTVQIPFHTIGNPWGVMEGMRIDILEIREETGEKKILSGVWIARTPFRLTKDGSYEVLLHKETFSS